jgi:protein phosphatase
MQVEIYAKSDVGQKRKNNEDNYLILDLTARYYWTGSEGPEPPAALHRLGHCEKGLILVAADGLGGEVAGEVASRMAVDTAREYLGQITPDAGLSLGEHLRDAVLKASQAIQRKGQDPAFHKLGSTFTGAAIQNGVLELAQVGDSRGYLMRGAEIKQITKDQTLVQQLVDIGQISAEDAEHHSYKHILIQALGTEIGVTPATGRIFLRRGDLLLLCSDGLSGKVAENELHEMVGDCATLAEACQKLVAEANARGGEDNITVVLARFNGEDLPANDGAAIVVERLGSYDEEENTTLGGTSYEELTATLPSLPSDLPPHY